MEPVGFLGEESSDERSPLQIAWPGDSATCPSGLHAPNTRTEISKLTAQHSNNEVIIPFGASQSAWTGGEVSRSTGLAHRLPAARSKRPWLALNADRQT